MKKTILYVLQYEIVGGPPLRVLQIAKHLRKKYRPVVILPRGGNAAEMFKKSGITTYEIHLERLRYTLNPLIHLRYILYFASTVLRILKIIKSEDVDLVIANNVMLLQAPIAAKLAGVKLIWHLEETVVPLWGKKIFSLIVRALANQIIVVSEAVRKFFYNSSSCSLSQKIAIIHAPVDSRKFRPDISPDKVRSELGLSKTNPVIGIIGNINLLKGHRYFLEAASIIKHKYPSSKFLVVGPKLQDREAYFESLKALCDELSLNENVIFTGGRQDIPEIIAALDILVLSSLSEACPMVVLEAMATGKPVVATRVGGVPEEIVDGKTGILVPSQNSKAIADAVLTLLANRKKMEEMGIEGRIRVKKYFTIEICAQKTEAVYQSLLE